MQYSEKTLTTKVNLNVPLHGINNDCLKLIPKHSNKKKQKLVVGNKKGFIQLFQHSKQQWSTSNWQEVNQKLPEDERGIKSLSICKILKSSKNKRDRILYSDGKYIKCVNKKNLLQSDNKDLDNEYGVIKKIFADDDNFIIQSDKNNCLYKINFQKNKNWLSLNNALKLRTTEHKPYLNQIFDLDYDYDSKNLVFTSLNCAFITDSQLNAKVGIGHINDLGRIKVFDLRKDRFTSFQIMPPKQDQNGNPQQVQYAQAIPIQSVLIESQTTNELLLGTYFNTQYAQIDQIITTSEKATCFGYGDIFKMEKNHILCGYQGGYQIFQENLNRQYELLDKSTKNILLLDEPNNCISGDFQNDMFHQGIGEFIISTQQGDITSISPLPDYKESLKGMSHNLNQFIAFKAAQQKATYTENQNNNSFSQVSSQIQDVNDLKKQRSTSLQPNLQTTNDNLKKQEQNNSNITLQQTLQNNSSQVKQTENENDSNLQNNISKNKSKMPPKPKKQNLVDLKQNREGIDNQQQDDIQTNEQKQQNNLGNAVEQNEDINQNNFQQQNNNKSEQDNSGFLWNFKSQLQPNKKFQIIDDEMNEIEKQFQDALNKTKQPFVLSKTNISKENSNYKPSSIIFSNNTLKNPNISAQKNVNNEQRFELIEKLIQNTSSNKFYDPEELLKITEKSPNKKDKNSNGPSPTKGFNQNLKNFSNSVQDNETSPSIRDINRGRVRRPSFTKPRNNSAANDDSQNQILDYLNQSNYLNLGDQNINKKLDIQQKSEIQSPIKVKQTLDSTRSNVKSNIEQNLEKELQKNQINLMNPLDLFKQRSQNEIQPSMNTQKQQKIKQDQRSQLQLMNRRRRISSDFQANSFEENDNQMNLIGFQEQLHQKNEISNEEQQNEIQCNNFNASPQKIQRQESIENFYNQDKNNERVKNRTSHHNDNSLYSKLEEIQQKDFQNTQQSFFNRNLNKDYSKDELSQNTGLSYQPSTEDLSFKQKNVTFNNLFQQKQPSNNGGYASAFSKRKDSFDFYEDDKDSNIHSQKNMIPNKNINQEEEQESNQFKNNKNSKNNNIVYIPQNQPNVNNFFLSDDNLTLNKSNNKQQDVKDEQEKQSSSGSNIKLNNQIGQEGLLKKSNKHFNEDLFDIYDNQKDNKEQDTKISQRINEINKGDQTSSKVEGKKQQEENRNQNEDQFEIYKQQNIKQPLNSQQKTNFDKVIDINNKGIQQPENKQVREGVLTSRSTRPQPSIPNSILRNSKLMISSIDKNNSKNNNPLQIKQKYVIESPTEKSSENQSKYFVNQQKKLQDHSTTWRHKIPSRSFLNEFQTGSHQLPVQQNQFYQYDQDQILDIEIEEQGYVTLPISEFYQNKKLQNNKSYTQYKQVKKYNPKVVQRILAQDQAAQILQQKQKQLHIQPKVNANSFDILEQGYDNEEIELFNLQKEIEELEGQMNEINKLNLEFNSSLNEQYQPVVYQKEVFYKQNRIRYRITSSYKIKQIFVFLKTVRSVEVTKPVKLISNKDDDSSDSEVQEFPAIQVIKCQGGNEEFKLSAFEIIILEQNSDTIFFDLLYNEDGFSVELIIQPKFEHFQDLCYEIQDKNKAFVFFQKVSISQTISSDERINSYHSLKFTGIQKNQLINIYNSLFEIQISEKISRKEEFVVKAVYEIFDIIIILHYQKNNIMFYSQSLQYIKCLQNRISSRFDENVQKVSSTIAESKLAYIYHFDKIFQIVRQRKDIREQQLIIIPLQEIVQTQGSSEGLSRQYIRLLSQQEELKEIYKQSNDFDEICRMQLENIVKCYIQINRALKPQFEVEREAIDNLIFNLRVKSIYSKLFPLENASFVGN